jgi:hypothetical protein
MTAESLVVRLLLRRLQAALDNGAEIDPFGTKAHARMLAEKASA